MERLDTSGLVTLKGNNFSGRTYLLRSLTGLESGETDFLFSPDFTKPNVYVGPEIYNSISGVTTTVEDELALHLENQSNRPLIDEIIKISDFHLLLQRNPFELSGGEQAILTLLSSLAIGPNVLALDCSLEQVSESLKISILQILKQMRVEKTLTIIADNRLPEYDLEFNSILDIASLDFNPQYEDPLQIEEMDSSINLQLHHSDTSELILDDIWFKYGSGPFVLKRINVQLESGKIYMLSGENGAGKTTLAKILSGVIKPSSGKIILNSREINTYDKPGYFVGYHYQNPDLQLFSRTVNEEITSGPAALGVNRNDYEKIKDFLLNIFGLTYLGNIEPLALPFTLRKRVAIVSILSMNRRWIILDEPILCQDQESSKVISEILWKLSKQGLGVIIITHSSWFKELVQHEYLLMQNGELIYYPETSTKSSLK